VPSTAAVAAGIIIIVAALVVFASVGITLPKHNSLNPFLEKSKYMHCQVKVCGVFKKYQTLIFPA
jgi:hypothetical protein